jgi:hypothetical protein
MTKKSPTAQPSPIHIQMTARLPSASQAAIAKPAATFNTFDLPDNVDQPFTIMGIDGAGNKVDISTLATITAISSDNTAVVTVDPLATPPKGVTNQIHAATPAPAIGATANVLFTVTWNDPANAPVGSPFKVTWPMTIVASPVGGVVPAPGTPTTH